ncbi:hypothetical protein Prubr_05690 [Polymorphospora rubra]|uniref:Uncharacterized protein n=1 Tax=Polymorphospora rubra TaxID=338584 RepID=A0A810MW49_9ACTN|nr:hypothetical protein Prubr_05690 [Polymorphospora rubra]
MLADLAQRRRRDLVDLAEQVGGAPALGTAAVGAVRALRVADQLRQRTGQYAVLGVLVGQPGVADRLAQFPQRRRLARGVEEGADGVVPLQGGPDLVDLDLVDAVDAVRPPFRLLADQQLDVDLEDVGDLVDDRELVEPADPPLDLVHPALRLVEPVGEDLLRHLPAGPPVCDAAPDGQFVHVRSSPSLRRRFRAASFRVPPTGLRRAQWCPVPPVRARRRR